MFWFSWLVNYLNIISYTLIDTEETFLKLIIHYIIYSLTQTQTQTYICY